jgi:hypothetical protein
MVGMSKPPPSAKITKANCPHVQTFKTAIGENFVIMCHSCRKQWRVEETTEERFEKKKSVHSSIMFYLKRRDIDTVWRLSRMIGLSKEETEELIAKEKSNFCIPSEFPTAA